MLNVQSLYAADTIKGHLMGGRESYDGI